MSKKNKHKRTLTPEELHKRESGAFHRKIRKVFCDMGFTHVETQGREFEIGHRRIEIDAAYIKENIVLLCEDTVGQNKKSNKAHVLKKQDAAERIDADRHSFLSWFVKQSPDAAKQKDDFGESRIKIFSLYFSKYHGNWTLEDVARYSSLRLISMRVFEYFRWMSQCIKQSALYEIYRYLGLGIRDIGVINNRSEDSVFNAPIVYPTQFIGGDERVRVVSFMISAEEMLKIAYVMRRDGWESSGAVYQRLIDKSKIRKIREFLCANRTTFYNNVIAVLPDSVKVDAPGLASKSIFSVSDEVTKWTQLLIPKDFNSVGIIDGQHRVYAYHEGGACEDKVSVLRKKLHLLVTGIVFPAEMTEIEKRKIQSKIFVDINGNAKPIDASLLLHIKKMQAPLADTSLAQDVIDSLNRSGLFEDKFQESKLSTGKIRSASIVKFALRYLVAIDPVEGKGSFIKYWGGDVAALRSENEDAMKSYINFCAKSLDDYFLSVKQTFAADWKWEGGNTLLPSVVTINGFLLALSKVLLKEGPQTKAYYLEKFKKLKVDFSKKKFKYRSSQYHKFAHQIVKDSWGDAYL